MVGIKGLSVNVRVYSTCSFFYCLVNFDVDYVQRRELVNIYEVYAI